jgi:hypothetical protein
MLTPGIMRRTPIIIAVGVKAVTRAVGRPAFSSSLATTAPQRVPVPQVDVKITAETSCFLSSPAMLSPSFWHSSTVVATPVVV